MKALAALPVLFAWLAVPLSADDWPGWRGPARDGHVPGFEAPEEWPSELEKGWTVVVGEGHASPVVAAGRVFQHSRQDDEEVVRALGLETGAEVWRASYAADFKPALGAGKHGRGPKATPAVAGGRLFTLSIDGVLSAWDAAGGKLLWRRDSVAFKDDQPKYGASVSPLAAEDLLVVHLGGGKEGVLLSLDPATGAERWSWPGDAPAYASPVLAELAGRRQVVTQGHHEIVGIDAASGDKLWEIPFKSSMVAHNVVTPLLVDDLVVLSGQKRGTWAVRPRLAGDRWSLEEVWRNDEVPMYLSSPVAAAGRVFGLSHKKKGLLFALDAATGAEVWTNGGRTAENAALLTADGVVLVLTSDADLLVLDAAADEMRQLASYRVAETETWAHPAVAGRRILVKDAESLTLWTLER